ncbi:hypothetical protein N7532_010420 [Penicillium argentinense]|uniref:Fungal lipase-type domain-containing protein n=1 Tax=Penicillium argentinense TaxID=1131581 RepID=A0A9W9JXM7_9EURO|nr:uncharacterized protein N7532_010420 [Penicillium argentinense]KAJ5085649.1 hypothetical protein N7532_010420 [Penicillium argentinense]
MLFPRNNFGFMCLVPLLWGAVSSAHNETRPISNELFNSLEELSRLVDISYCVGTTGVQKPFQCLSHCSEFPNLELITAWSTGVLLSDNCGYIALSHEPGEKRIIIAFRGTYSITNTIIDLSAYPQSYVPYPGNDSDRESKTQPEKHCTNCTVHAGFLKSWTNTRETVLPRIASALEKYPNYEVTLVGHSLGGAVAALAGLEMQLKGWNPTVTTFGEPMVGNADFASFLNEQFELETGRKSRQSTNSYSYKLKERKYRRVTHINDPVPLLPLREWGYAPHAGEIFISRAELSPAVRDVRLCIGNEDPGCIAGAESPERELLDMYQDINIPLDTMENPVEPCYESPEMISHPNAEQQVVIGARSSPRCKPKEATSGLYPRNWDWSFIPGRYRLWELFYAHRDYFWRIGLCVPGGDPTG